MVELIYPARTAALCKGCKAAKSTEMFPVCDESGNVLYQASRDFCHRSGLLHPVVNLSIIDRRGFVVLQKRSARKDNWPLKWDFAAAGHMIYGEEVLEALRREVWEEIGLTDFNPVHLASYVFENRKERELVNSFAAVGNFDLKPDEEEVADVKLWSEAEIRDAMGKDIFTPAFEYGFTLICDKLFALL